MIADTINTCVCAILSLAALISATVELEVQCEAVILLAMLFAVCLAIVIWVLLIVKTQRKSSLKFIGIAISRLIIIVVVKYY